MKVGCVSIKGFKSIQDTVELHLRDTLTCLIGANEHGKSNILLAIQKIGEQKLNIADKNTVMANDGKEDIPTIMFELRLEEQDKPKILDKLTPLANTSKTAISTTGPENTVPQPEDEKSKLLKEFLLTFEEKNEVILKLTINITGRSYSYDKWINLGQYLPELIDVLEQLLPKSYLFAPSNQIVDSISLDELNTRHSIEFEGLLKLANFWERKEILFENGANAAGMRIKASRLLRSKVKKLWSQGKRDYNFEFTLQSNGRLALTIEDSTGNFDSPSSRSLGFRAFFSFYLAIFAYTYTISPSGYIFLFDEPEIHLHPEAQKDLLRELRNLGKNNQIVFATHSPFMIDKNNLLSTVVIKKETRKGKSKGTKVVHKPYLNNWLAVRESLGVLMGDTLLYTSRSLFVEGTSDRLFVTSILEKYKNELNLDMNYLSILDGDQRKELIGVARILLSEGRKLILMVDGDGGGETLTKQYKELAEELERSNQIEILNLKEITGKEKSVSIEDFLPIDTFSQAVTKYIKEILHREEIKDFSTKLKTKEKTITRGKAFVELLASELSLKEETVTKTTIADFFGQITADLKDIYPDIATKLAEKLKVALTLE